MMGEVPEFSQVVDACLEHGLKMEIKGEKIDVIKFKRRKGYKRKQGHRQRSLRVKIGEITG